MLASARRRSDRRASITRLVIETAAVLSKQDREVIAIDTMLEDFETELDVLDMQEAKLVLDLGEIHIKRSSIRRQQKQLLAKRAELERTVDQPIHKQMADLAQLAAPDENGGKP